jgi:signal transduction histidine kinase
MSRVLIVDDGTENLYLLRTLLQGHGHDVDEASNGAEALAKANVRPPDLVISDLLMPVMDGYALLRHWRSHDELKSIPFIVYTATYTEPRDERLALDLGADAFIVKPAEPEILIARVEEILAKRRSAAPTPDLEEPSLLKEHTEVLVRKLEKKVRELEEANRRLVQEAQERERAQEALRASEERLRQAQKMEAVGRLASGVAHDFNNLLTVVASHAEILLGMRDANETVRTSARSIAKASQRAAAVTRRLLGFGRHAAVKQEVVDLNQVVTDACELVTCSLGANIEIETNLAKETCRTSIDPAQLDQIIMNLAINARDAMPDGGRLTIETRLVELEGGARGEHAADCGRGPRVVLTVRDTGHGMSAETLARIFDPFYTTKPDGRGTGLGLAIVRSIVQQNGGCIHVHSELDKGSTFEVFLPAVDLPLTRRTDATPALDLHGSETILLVEDNEDVREVAQASLELYGYRVLSARDPVQALELAQQHEIDMLVSDCVLPNGSGTELVVRLRQRLPHLNALLMSGYMQDTALRHGPLKDAIAFLQKPYTPVTLARKVREVLDDRGLARAKPEAERAI